MAAGQQGTQVYTVSRRRRLLSYDRESVCRVRIASEDGTAINNQGTARPFMISRHPSNEVSETPRALQSGSTAQLIEDASTAVRPLLSECPALYSQISLTEKPVKGRQLDTSSAYVVTPTWPVPLGISWPRRH